MPAILQTRQIWKLWFHNSLITWGRKLMWIANLPSFQPKSLLDIWLIHAQGLSGIYSHIPCNQNLIKWNQTLTWIKEPGSFEEDMLKNEWTDSTAVTFSNDLRKHWKSEVLEISVTCNIRRIASIMEKSERYNWKECLITENTPTMCLAL